MLWFHSYFVVAFSFLFFFFTLRTVFWIRYKFDVISSNAYRSVVRMTQVFDLEKNVLFRKRWCKLSSEKMTLYNNGFLIH